MDRFFTPLPLVAGEFVLDGPEAHHLATVRRAGAGECVILFNGDGVEYLAEILGTGKRTVTLQIGERREVSRERHHALTVAAAMPKGDRGDFLVEKLVELGVSRFVPLITERTVVVPKESRLESLRRTVIEASKQCGRNVLMTIDEPAKWMQFSKRGDLPATKLILNPTATQPLTQQQMPCVIAVGPEGGFTDDEVQAANWLGVSLGPTILRIETAALAAAAQV